MSEPVLEFRQVHCVRDDAKLHDVSLPFEAGSSVLVFGDTSSLLLLRLASLQERPDAGEMLIRGQSVHTLPEKELADLRSRQIGVVFSAAHLLPGLTAVENVAVPLFKLLSLETAEAAERTHAMLEYVGFQGEGADDALMLTRADQQRVALARALVHRPSILILYRAEEALAPDDAMAFRKTIHRACTDFGVLALAAPSAAGISYTAHRFILVEDGFATDPHAPVKP
jgi:predicted ABC-type transport system involved in lysophospholipase L1 biosynthesis ATPase subunit